MLDLSMTMIRDNAFIFSMISMGIAIWPNYQNWKIQKRKKAQQMQFQTVCQQIRKSPNGGDCLYWAQEDQYICPVCLYSENRITPVFEEDQSGYYTCDRCKSRHLFNRINAEIAKKHKKHIS